MEYQGKKSVDRLLIVDPNNPSNDISGGSRLVRVIFQRFYDAYDALNLRMSDVEREPVYADGRMRGSILGCVWGGEYDSFIMQRAKLQKLFGEGYGVR